MTEKTSTFMKLIVLCALMWVQALQVDHVTDQALEGQHTDCLVCKSVGDTALGGSGIALQTDYEYAKTLASTYISQPAQQVIFGIHPARAPPTAS